MSYIVVDVESDGPIIGKHSMVCFGAVLIDREGKLNKTYFGKTQPISKYYDPKALAISGYTREQHEEDFDSPIDVMPHFSNWLKEISIGKPILISDNNGYDASWINWYFLTFTGSNPFGWTSRRIGDMFAGFMNNPYYKWTKHRISKYTHHPVDDAKGNAEALLWLKNQGYKINF